LDDEIRNILPEKGMLLFTETKVGKIFYSEVIYYGYQTYHCDSFWTA